MSNIILTPGPVEPPDFILDALRQPPVHHRSAEFGELYEKLQEGLRYLFQTDERVLALGGSGTFAFEMAMKGLFRKGERVLVPHYGKFGERWARYGQYLGLKVVPLEMPWGEHPDVEALTAALNKANDWAGVILTHCETSTGVGIDLEEMAFSVRSRFPEALILADTMSTAGVIPLYIKEWGIDVGVVSSPKALMNPAGTVFLSLSERAEARLQPDTGDDIFNLWRYVESAKDLAYPVTPPTQLFYGIQAALEHLQKMGLPQIWNRNHQLSRRLKKAIPELVGELFGKANCDAMTAFTLPDFEAQEVLARLKTEYGIEIAGGQSGWKGKLLRVAHFATSGDHDPMAVGVEKLITALTEINS